MEGITKKTKDVLDKISSFESIKDYVMIGGTALSLQLKHRLSEDIDFCQWKKFKDQKLSVDCTIIEKELATIGEFKKFFIGNGQVDYIINEVKITFLCDSRLKQPENLKLLDYKNNVKLADIHSIGAMKLEVLLRRSTFRDYYDIFSIIKAGKDFNAIVDDALKYSKHVLRSRDVISMLSNGSQFDGQDIKHLCPQYNVTPKDIENFLTPHIKKYAESKGKVFPNKILMPSCEEDNGGF